MSSSELNKASALADVSSRRYLSQIAADGWCGGQPYISLQQQSVLNKYISKTRKFVLLDTSTDS